MHFWSAAACLLEASTSTTAILNDRKGQKGEPPQDMGTPVQVVKGVGDVHEVHVLWTF